MAGFELINESSQGHSVNLTITSTDGEKLHEESYEIDAGWSRLTREGVFESQQCQYSLAIDGETTDTYDYSPSCTDFEDEEDNLAIVLSPPEVEYLPKECGGNG